jgi:hypothetical protein
MSVIRWLPAVVIVVGVACAQSPSSSPSPSPLVAETGANDAAMNTITPNAIAPGDASSAHAQLEIPPLPSGKTTLIGGTIERVDHVRDRLVLQAFGGQRTAVLFDERTRVFRDGKTTSVDDLKNGERAYVDTSLDGVNIFARNIRISASGPTGQSSGQIVAYRPKTGELIVRDEISPEPVTMRVASNTVIVHGDRNVQANELRPGTLVTLAFSPRSGELPVVQQISILASPGTVFYFTGRVDHIDLRRGLLVITDPRDNKSYDVYFDPASRHTARELRPGVDVIVQATFDGSRYQSRQITVNSVSAK